MAWIIAAPSASAAQAPIACPGPNSCNSPSPNTGNCWGSIISAGTRAASIRSLGATSTSKGCPSLKCATYTSAVSISCPKNSSLRKAMFWRTFFRWQTFRRHSSQYYVDFLPKFIILSTPITNRDNWFAVESLWMYLTAGIVGLAVLVIALLLYYFCCKSSSDKRPNLQHESSLKGSVRSPCRKGKGSGLEMSALIPGSASSSVKSDARARVREFHPANIRFIQELGEGAFGKVYKGEIVGTGDEPMLVAIKTLKENASAKTTADFKREVDLMCELRHENIVCLLGVCLTREPLSMLFEFMPKGDLHEFLITHSPHTTEHPLNQADLLKMAVHIAA
ncbi:unnamed protein product, partial [Nesidiocoris tenuis]